MDGFCEREHHSSLEGESWWAAQAPYSGTYGQLELDSVGYYFFNYFNLMCIGGLPSCMSV